MIALKLYGHNGLEILGRAVAMSVTLSSAARASTHRAFLSGEAQDDKDRALYADMALELLASTSRAFVALLRVLIGMPVNRGVATGVDLYMQV